MPNNKTCDVLYGVCGSPLAHSYSAVIHGLLGNGDYTLLPMEKKEFQDFLKAKAFRGINVTIPYKKVALDYCDSVSDTVKRIGALNTVVNKGGKLYGYNTDCFGFSYLVNRLGVDVKDKVVLIAGTGGTSLTVSKVVQDLGAKKVLIASRRGTINYSTVYAHTDINLLINTTPVGMYPKNGESLFDLRRFSQLQGVIDVIYNPLKTKLITDALALHIPAIGGLGMLVAQAVKAHELFFDTPFEDIQAKIADILNKCLNKVANVILIGMPGCGKTTVGKLFAQKAGLPFYDTDEEITRRFGKTPQDMILQDGEAVFRKRETAVLQELTKTGGAVIAVGGGAVIAEENRVLLKQNGRCIYIDRPLACLDTVQRPLSNRQGVRKLYAKRHVFYEELSDFTIPNTDTPQQGAEAIYRHFFG